MTIKYSQKYLELYPVACDSCGCEVPTSSFGAGHSPTGEKKKEQELCRFCAETLGGTYTQYDHHGDMFAALRQEIWKAAACVVNHLKESK